MNRGQLLSKNDGNWSNLIEHFMFFIRRFVNKIFEHFHVFLINSTRETSLKMTKNVQNLKKKVGCCFTATYAENNTTTKRVMSIHPLFKRLPVHIYKKPSVFISWWKKSFHILIKNEVFHILIETWDFHILMKKKNNYHEKKQGFHILIETLVFHHVKTKLWSVMRILKMIIFFSFPDDVIVTAYSTWAELDS